MLRAIGKRDRRQWAEKGMFLVEWNENSRHGLTRNDAPYISFGYSSTKSVHTFTIYLWATRSTSFAFSFFLSSFLFIPRWTREKYLYFVVLDFSFSRSSVSLSFFKIFVFLLSSIKYLRRNVIFAKSFYK